MIKPLTAADLAWMEERTIELMHLGLKLADAAELAAWERTQYLDQEWPAREREFAVALSVERRRRHDERESEDAAKRAKHRAEMEASATQAKPGEAGPPRDASSVAGGLAEGQRAMITTAELEER